MGKTYVAMEKIHHKDDEKKFEVKLVASSPDEGKLLSAMIEKVRSLGMHPEVTMVNEQWKVSYHEPYDVLVHDIVIEAVNQI